MIIFKKVRWKNFLSTGSAFTEIELDRNPNTLIIGQNGAGKSTILDALCYGLYGKPFRKVKKDQLINSINGRDCLIEVELNVYNKDYKIVRGIKPTIFEIYENGKLVDQTAASKDYQEHLEKNILRLNMKSFTQIVVLGSSSFIPFMQLPTGVRREVIEDLLDIRIFSSMSNLLKERISTNKEDITTTNNELKNSQEVLNIHEQQKLKDQEKKQQVIEENNRRIEELQNAISVTNGLIAISTTELEQLLESISDKEKNKIKMDKILKIESDLEDKKKKSKKVIQFYSENDNCPTCSQHIDEAIKSEKIKEKESAILEVETAMINLNNQLAIVEKRNEEILFVSEQIKQKQTYITQELNSSIIRDQQEITLLQKQISKEDNDNNNDVMVAIESIKEKQKQLETQKQELLSLKDLYEFASIILKDGGIKSKIIKQYIPIMNSLVNKYLASMDFFVKFELDETFEEKILSRHRDDFTYDSFSEGEKMRIDLALLFTWRTIARMKNSANTNLLILDEVFDASLDTNGCDEFLKLIHGLENANVFVISHKGDILQDKFGSIIRFEKQKNFSRMI